jgi:regulation of enolase protein 1 (concanavalin A-like superfamily)
MTPADASDLESLAAVGTLTTAPVDVGWNAGALRVAAARGSDAWRHTAYGFVHDTEHGLLAPMPTNSALEVSFILDYDQQFDQAGLLVRESPTEWIKAGVEVSDGLPQVGAVVTHGTYDWSVAPVPEWAGREVSVRASRAGDAVTIRARAQGEAWRLVRVAHLDPDATVSAGLYCASPTRDGLVVTFTGYRTGEPDSSLH